jgi:hypothetical protein
VGEEDAEGKEDAEGEEGEEGEEGDEVGVLADQPRAGAWQDGSLKRGMTEPKEWNIYNTRPPFKLRNAIRYSDASRLPKTRVIRLPGRGHSCASSPRQHTV